MEKEPIKIETMAQLFEVLTPENVARFLLDFCVFAEDAVKIKTKFPQWEVKSMSWIDDGIVEVTSWQFVDEDGDGVLITKKKGAQ